VPVLPKAQFVSLLLLDQTYIMKMSTPNVVQHTSGSSYACNRQSVRLTLLWASIVVAMMLFEDRATTGACMLV
jgi:hypothetical protein